MKLNVTVDIGRIPETADDWELYTSSMNCTVAARALTAALKKALRAVAKGATTYEAMKAHFDPVARKYADYGAQDSEPTHHAERILDRVRAMTTGRGV